VSAHPMSRQFRQQARHSLPGSPLYEQLLTALADDLDRGGVTAAVVAGHEQDRPGTVLPLRLLGAVHRLVLTGALPDLARCYPSAGGTAPAAEAWPALEAALAARTGEVRALLERPVQTNETGRAALLYGALMVVAARTGLPVRLLEIGASAGLNLLVDRYRYDVVLQSGSRIPRTLTLGDPASPLVFDRPWRGVPPAVLRATVPIAERRGCDPNPIDPADPDGRLTLASFVWPDDLRRLGRLRAALRVAAADPPTVDRAGAATWLAHRLRVPWPGVATVVWHSVVWQYVDRADRPVILETIGDAAARATAAAPLAYVRFEPRPGPPESSGVFELRASIWPHRGVDELLATGVGHGIPARWSL
jgi:hypothetical protein